MTVSNIKKAIYGLSVPATLAATNMVMAQGTNIVSDGASSVSDNLPQQSFTSLVNNIIYFALFLIGLASVIMLIYGGFRYVFSAGEEKATKAGKDAILYSIIGIVVALLSFAIVQFVVGGVGGSTTK